MTEADAALWAYIRVSTDEQAKHGYSLEAQEEAVRKYQSSHQVLKDLSPATVIVDAGKSAKKYRFMERPGGKDLCLRMKRGDTLLLPKVDRAFRRFSDMIFMMDLWEHRGIMVHIMDLKGVCLDQSTPMGRAMIRMLAVFAELEADFASQRTKDVIRKRRRDGKHINQYPGYGNKLVGRAGAKMAVPDAEELRQMGRIADMRAKGFSIEEIYVAFREDGERTREGKEWSRTRIERAGKVEEQRRSTATPKTA